MSQNENITSANEKEPQTMEQALEIINSAIKTIEYRASLDYRVRMVDDDYQLDILANNLKKAYDIVYYNSYVAQAQNAQNEQPVSSNQEESIDPDFKENTFF